MNWALPLAALVVSGASLVLATFFAARSLSKSASAEYVDQLEKRVAECEKVRLWQTEEISRLRDRELDLLTRLVRLEER